MSTLTIPYGEDLPAALGLSKEEFEREMRFWMAAKLFEQGSISSGKGAEMAGMERVHFIMELGRRGIPVIDMDEDEIEEEFSYSRKLSSSTQAS